jgi:hypothetical protein
MIPKLGNAMVLVHYNTEERYLIPAMFHGLESVQSGFHLIFYRMCEFQRRIELFKDVK